MALEMLFSIILIVFAGYCITYVHASAATTVYTDPLGTTFWPTLLLSALIVLLCINVVQIYLRTPKEKRNLDSITKINIKSIMKSRLTWGILLTAAYALLLPTTGFLLTSFLMGIALSYLLGEHRPKVLIVASFLIVAIVFVVFYKGMSIQLPRGTVPFLRNMSLAAEAVLRSIGG